MAGDFNTGFIAEQYPKGFSAQAVVHERPEFLLALAVAAHRRRLGRAAGLSGQLPGHEYEIDEHFAVEVVDADGRRQHTPVSVLTHERAFVVKLAGQSLAVTLQGSLRDIAVHGDVNGVPFCAQIERVGLKYRVTHNGAALEAHVMSARAAELNLLMPFKAPPDLSKYLLSPMPGLLVDVAVTLGQTVRAGERLAVIEAMKMENILVATQDCVVAAVKAGKGESLAVDQVILEFR
jgi:propionyl-CoA carboxylase alpha chain